MSEHLSQCALCSFGKSRACRSTDGKGPEGCPTLEYSELAQETFKKTMQECGEFWAESARQEGSGYACKEQGNEMRRPAKPRIVEVVEFARRMQYKRLGLIFCGGLHKEAKVVHEILETNGFEVVSVMCKAGRILKSDVGIEQEEQCDIFTNAESICNPAFQAEITNAQNTDFNILMGLCVGHDTIAIKYLKAPCTVFAVKDRLTGHNPLAPIYMYDSYYKFLKKPLP